MNRLSIAVFLLFRISVSYAQQSIHFEPKSYSNVFSAKLTPALRIQPGDTVYTTSVDAGGLDKHGVRIAKRGNPLTGPFLIEGAEPGDILAITFLRVSLNRNFATTLNALVPRALPKSIAQKPWRYAKLVKWRLDLVNNLASPMDTGLQRVTVPLHPFIGCVGVAPEGDKEMGTGASGPYGGNLDFRYNTSGASIYLPVFHAGAFLYLGDGHAAQGDGELNGDALETSLDFGFTVKLLKKTDFPLETPMVENEQYCMFFGIESTLDKSLRTATNYMSIWLQSQYHLNPVETSQVIGPSVEYRIPKIAASKVEVVAMIPRDLLLQIKLH